MLVKQHHPVISTLVGGLCAESLTVVKKKLMQDDVRANFILSRSPGKDIL